MTLERSGGRAPKPRMRPDGRWEYRRTVKGRAVSAIDRSKESARQKYEDKLDEVLRVLASGGNDPTLENLFEQFVEVMADLRAPSTLATYELARSRLLGALGRFRVSQLTRPLIRRVYLGLPLTGRSLEQSHDVLCTVLNWGISEGRISQQWNPFARMQVTHEHLPGRLDVFDLHQLDRLFSALQGSYSLPLFMLLAITGCRLGEALGLTWDCCQLDGPQPYIRVAQSLRRHCRLKCWYLAPCAKNSRSARTIPIPLRLATVLRSLCEAQIAERASGSLFIDPRIQKTVGKGKLVSAGPELQLVFVAPLKRGFVDPTHVGEPLQRATDRAGLPRIRVHDLRHSCATNLFAMGWRLELVSERLGHSSSLITEKTYRAYIPSLQQDIASAQEPWAIHWSNPDPSVVAR